LHYSTLILTCNVIYHSGVYFTFNLPHIAIQNIQPSKHLAPLHLIPKKSLLLIPIRPLPSIYYEFSIRIIS